MAERSPSRGPQRATSSWLRGLVSPAPATFDPRFKDLLPGLQRAAWAGFAAGFFWVLYHAVAGAPRLALAHAAFLGFWTAASWLLVRGKVLAALQVSFFGLMALVAAVSAERGFDTGMVWYLLLIPFIVFLLPRRQKAFKITWTVAALACGWAVHGWTRAHAVQGEDAADTVFLLVTNTFLVLTLLAWFTHLFKTQADRLEAAAALTDALTGLPNRLGFEGRLQEWVRQARREKRGFSYWVVDVDRFSLITRTHGVEAGDELLRQIAERLKASGAPDAVTARLGDDRFAVLEWNDAGRGAGGTLGDRLTRSLRDALRPPAPALTVTACAGAAFFPGDAAVPGDLQRAAEQALQEARNTRRGSYRLFDPAVDVLSRRRGALLDELELEGEAGPLRLEYQPRYVVGGRLESFEALLRYRSPRFGETGMAELLPLLEESGRIEKIGLWAVLEAIRQQAEWARRLPAPVPVSVNLSPLQCANPDFADRVLDAVRRATIDPAWLRFEIPEDAFLAGPTKPGEASGGGGRAPDPFSAVLETVARLRAAGHRVAADRFGAGAASVLRMAAIRVDGVCLDRSLIAAVAAGGRQEEAVRWILEISRALGRPTLAVGVDREEQREALRALGCEAWQGHLFSPPLAPDRAFRLQAPGASP